MAGGGCLRRLPFGGDVLFLSGEGSEAVVGEEGRAVLLDEAFDGLTPPAGVSVAAALQHQGPAQTHGWFLFFNWLLEQSEHLCNGFTSLVGQGYEQTFYHFSYVTSASLQPDLQD